MFTGSEPNWTSQHHFAEWVVGADRWQQLLFYHRQQNFLSCLNIKKKTLTLILSVFFLDPVLFPSWLSRCCFKVWLLWLVCKPPFLFRLPSIFDLIYFASSSDAVKANKRYKASHIAFTSSLSIIHSILDGICGHNVVKRLIKKESRICVTLAFLPPFSLFTPQHTARPPFSLICLFRRQSGGNCDTFGRDLRVCHTSRLSCDDNFFFFFFSRRRQWGDGATEGLRGCIGAEKLFPPFFN